MADLTVHCIKCKRKYLIESSTPLWDKLTTYKEIKRNDGSYELKEPPKYWCGCFSGFWDRLFS